MATEGRQARNEPGGHAATNVDAICESSPVCNQYSRRRDTVEQ